MGVVSSSRVSRDLKTTYISHEAGRLMGAVKFVTLKICSSLEIALCEKFTSDRYNCVNSAKANSIR